MQIRDCSSWGELKEALKDLALHRDVLKKDAIHGVRVPELLFRGHSNASWKLQTTLERNFGGDYDVVAYYRLIHKVKLEIETYFQKKWDIPLPEEWAEGLKKSSFSVATYIVNSGALYEYLVFLRHYGFPSPLLDWSRSPYVAAFFAARRAPLNDAAQISIFAFLDSAGQGKFYEGGLDGVRQIEGLGPNVRGQKRHFLQQCEYTICTRTGFNNQFISHEEIVGRDNVLKKSLRPQLQDLLFKFNIPASEVPAIISELNQYNLNAFSLFATDDSYVEALSIREVRGVK